MISRQRSSLASPEPPFLHVSVLDPVKLGNGVRAYISYCVTTKTNLPEYHGPQKIVIRRYNDFVWLRERFAEKYKGIFIPPLPEKNAIEKFRFSAEFIELRRRALEVFLSRVTSHPHLRLSEDLRSFLQADEDVWAAEKARSQEGSVFQKRPGDLMQMIKDVQSKVTDIVLGKDKPIEEYDPEYEKLKHYINELEDLLAQAQKQSFRLARRYKELGQAFVDFGKAMKDLGSCENVTLQTVFAEFGAQSDSLSDKLQQQGHDLMVNFEEPLKEYLRTMLSIKIVMSDRAIAFRQQTELEEVARLKEINLEKLRFVRPDRVLEAEADFKETRTQSEEARERFEKIVKAMQQEMTRFQEQRTRDLSAVFYKFARAQAQLGNDTADTWRVLLSKLS